MTQTALPVSKYKPPRSSYKNWIGVVPFLLFAILFLFLPSMRLFIGSFTNDDGAFTLENVTDLFTQKYILNSYLLSIKISAVTALGGGIFGFLLAYSVTVGGLPKIPALGVDHVFGRGFQLCWRASGVCLCCHAGTHGLHYCRAQRCLST